jgi:uncharacterized protein (DUF4415 family)
MRDEDIDSSDILEVTPEMFARGVRRVNLRPVSREVFARAVRRALRRPLPRKKQLTLRIDNDVVAWYRSQGRGYQTRINALLRAYMQESLKAGA